MSKKYSTNIESYYDDDSDLNKVYFDELEFINQHSGVPFRNLVVHHDWDDEPTIYIVFRNRPYYLINVNALMHGVLEYDIEYLLSKVSSIYDMETESIDKDHKG